MIISKAEIIKGPTISTQKQLVQDIWCWLMQVMTKASKRKQVGNSNRAEYVPEEFKLHLNAYI